jgi:hypothetical protein
MSGREGAEGRPESCHEGAEPAPGGEEEGAGAVEASALVAAVRAESGAARLATLDALRERYPDADVEALLASSGAADLELIRGNRTTYYFSTQGMTRAYATHLARIEERDPLRLVVETVRDESRIYPRPTDLGTFASPPFGLSKDDLSAILASLGKAPETEDIRSCRTSNGAVYLYSTRHLSPEHAEGLAEWEAVGRWNNP